MSVKEVGCYEQIRKWAISNKEGIKKGIVGTLAFAALFCLTEGTLFGLILSNNCAGDMSKLSLDVSRDFLHVSQNLMAVGWGGAFIAGGVWLAFYGDKYKDLKLNRWGEVAYALIMLSVSGLMLSNVLQLAVQGGIIDSLQGKKVDIGALREMYTMANGAMITTLALGILAYIAVELSLRSKPKLVKASICLQELRDVESRI